jgi:hypothetical protein
VLCLGTKTLGGRGQMREAIGSEGMLGASLQGGRHQVVVATTVQGRMDSAPTTHSTSVSQVALAWLLAEAAVTSVIPVAAALGLQLRSRRSSALGLTIKEPLKQVWRNVKRGLLKTLESSWRIEQAATSGLVQNPQCTDHGKVAAGGQVGDGRRDREGEGAVAQFFAQEKGFPLTVTEVVQFTAVPRQSAL